MTYASHNLTDTIVALATPSGVGAIGVIRLSGKEAIGIVNEVFHEKDLARQPTHTLHFGTIRDDSGRILDEVVVSLFIEPRSYTGENVVEVSCHGSSYILQETIQLFIEKGARLAQPGEFTLRAFLNGRLDLSQAEAVADLIASSSKASHNIAMQQMRGGFSDKIKKLRQELIDFASLIELELDFAEEDVEFANRGELKKLVEKIQAVLRALIQSFKLGNVLKHGVNTVIAGRPNAGKSTLLNALLNEERAIVSEIAGTNLLDTGAHFYDVFECSDGKYISLGSIEPQFYAELLQRTGLEGDPEFAQQMNREMWPHLKSRLKDVFRTRTRDEWCAEMEATDVCFAPVLTMSEAAAHPHNIERNSFIEIAGVPQPAPAPRFSRTVPEVSMPPAHPGQHSREVLADWGIASDRIEALLASGAVKDA